jgi:hypothetical protein
MWDGQFCPIGSVDNLEENPNRLLQMQQLLTEGVSKLLTTGDARPERGGWLLALAELNWPRAKAPEIDWVGLRQSYLRGDLGDHPRLVRLPFAGRWRSDGGTGNSGGSSDHKVVGYCPSCGILTVSRTMELWGNSHKAWREGGDEKERLNRLLYEGTPLLCRLCQQASWQLAPKGEVPPPDAAPPHIAGEGWHIRNFTRYA